MLTVLVNRFYSLDQTRNMSMFNCRIFIAHHPLMAFGFLCQINVARRLGLSQPIKGYAAHEIEKRYEKKYQKFTDIQHPIPSFLSFDFQSDGSFRSNKIKCQVVNLKFVK